MPRKRSVKPFLLLLSAMGFGAAHAQQKAAPIDIALPQNPIPAAIRV
ncbi:MAG: hypothetical protein WCU88_13380 [Elusimicrobiota bacterium]